MYLFFAILFLNLPLCGHLVLSDGNFTLTFGSSLFC